MHMGRILEECASVITEEEEDNEGEGRRQGGVIRARQEE
jgi:hypothetical protein